MEKNIQRIAKKKRGGGAGLVRWMPPNLWVDHLILSSPFSFRLITHSLDRLLQDDKKGSQVVFLN